MKRLQAFLLIIPLLFFLSACSQSFEEKSFIGNWKYDMESIREQLFKNGKLKHIKKNEKEIDNFIKPMATLVVSYNADHSLTASADSMIQTGTWEIRESNYFVTNIGGIEKIYKIKSTEADKLVLLETMPKSPIREFILHRVE